MLSETLPIGSGQSGVFIPSNGVTDVIMEGKGKGAIVLKARPIGGSKWTIVTSNSGAYNMSTPDTGIEYTFFYSDLKEPVNVYMGP